MNDLLDFRAEGHIAIPVASKRHQAFASFAEKYHVNDLLSRQQRLSNSPDLPPL